MRFFIVATVLWVCHAILSSTASAQSLTQQLQRESAAALAAAARASGNAVRGAIVFTRQEVGCTQCHVTGRDDLLGPDLTRVSHDLTDAQIVESLLAPSRSIRKGFESVTVVTQAGRALSGRIVSQTGQELILRDVAQQGRLISVASSEIDEVVVNQVSTMPDKLIDRLKDRAEFLDLTRYVFDLAALGSSKRVAATIEGGATIAPALQGMVLLSDFNCVSCHRDDASILGIPAKQAPVLVRAGARIDPQYLKRFLADPLGVKHGTTMPDVMATLPLEERRQAAEELTHYLASLTDQSFVRQPVDVNAAARGRTLYHSVGCVACHSPRDGSGQETLPDDSVPLGTPRDKYSVESLTSFLEDPHAVRPSGRMPNMKLTHWEALELANYLIAGSNQHLSSHAADFRIDKALASAGQTRFTDLGCIQCHQAGEAATRSASATPLSQLRLDHGCLSADTGGWPRYELSAEQRQSMQLALSRPPQPLDDDQRVAVTMTALRCLNCHQRGDLGGVSPDRNPHFQTTNANLGPQGRIPPTLTGVGAKLNPKWMRQVLVSGRAIRPYVKTRMPQYGADNVGHLVELLQRVDSLPEMEFAEFKDQKEMRQIGGEMVGTGGLNCIVCHTFQLKRAANMPAVDLTEMSERLQKNWFYHYMKDPQQFSLNTVMPSFWSGGVSMRKDVLDGDPDMQIEALWQYLLDGRQARTPRGLIREPMELLATDEAVMLRRSYPEIGKRGIGVGYPSGVNIAFDAEQMRLAMIWKGKFADPAGVWRSQGHGQVRPLGESRLQFMPGPDVDDASTPWIVDEGRPPNHRFKGYSLDDRQRPAFRYEVADVAVEDYFLDLVDPESNQRFLRRTLTLQWADGQPTLMFRAAAGKTIVSEGENVFVVDDTLRLRIQSQSAAQIVNESDGQQLRVLLDGSVRTSTLTIDYIW